MYRSRPAFALAMAALAAILLPSTLTAQITFQRTYGGPESDEGYSIQQTSDGGYVVTGSTASFGAGYCDVYLVKANAAGDTLWTRTYGGRYDDGGLSVQQTGDGGYIVAGYTCSFGPGESDVYLVRTDLNGDTLWTKTFGGIHEEAGYSVQQTTDSGFIIAGFTSSFGADWENVYLVKTDAAGDSQWTRTFGGASLDMGYSVQQTSDGGYVLAGETWSFGAGPGDVYVVKTDAGGDTVWTRTYGGVNDDEGNSVQQTTDGGYIIAGATDSHGSDSDDVYLVKTDADGETLWTRTFGGTGYESGQSVRQTADSGYVVAGFTRSFGAGAMDIYLIKTNASGNTRWTRAYGGAEDDLGYSTQRTTDGGYVISGYTQSFGAGGSDIYLIKTDSLGMVDAVEEPKTSPVRTANLSLTCEPNPCRGRTAISLQLTADSPAEVAIFDASGRRVRTFTVNRTPYTVWDGTDELGHALPSGAYFVRADNGNEHATARIVLQR